MEAGGPLHCSQEPVTGPYPEPEESNSHLPIRFKIRFNIILSSTPMSFTVVSFISDFLLNSLCTPFQRVLHGLVIFPTLSWLF
jgi:hypothetical protein